MAAARAICDDASMDSPDVTKRFHGWRLLAVIAVVVVVLAAISFVVDWAVVGPLRGRVL